MTEDGATATAEAEAEAEGRFEDSVGKLLRRSGPLAGCGFESGGNSAWQRLRDAKVLVVGAGGLGCEVLKDLALSGFARVTVIDMDTVEHSNLNRQFLFRAADVRRPKAVAAAAFVNARVGAHVVTPVVGPLQDQPRSFYRQFALVVAGLDSVPARRWLNFTLCGLVERDAATGEVLADSVVPLVDGGTEGWKGHVRVILPRFSACFECAIDAFPPQEKFPICTIASEPRLPEHAVQFASEVAWNAGGDEYPRPFAPGTRLDPDNPDHIQWVYEVALRRAEERGIAGVTPRLVLGVVKNIVPAIAATNALVAAACACEAFKIVTSASQTLENYFMYNGAHGVYSFTFEYARSESCMACGVPTAKYAVAPCLRLADLVAQLGSDPHFQLQSPSIRMPGKNLIMQHPEALRAATEKNLGKSLEELGVTDGAELTISDPVLPVALVLVVNFITAQQ